MRTFVAKPEQAHLERKWWVIDAKGKTLGRLASEAAQLLRGKHKPTFTPHVDTGDFVIVINAAEIKVTGNKVEGKLYYRHSGFPGGIKQRTFRELVTKHPTQPVQKAIKGMLPKNRLGSAMLTKLKVYATAEHPHAAQLPTLREL